MSPLAHVFAAVRFWFLPAFLALAPAFSPVRAEPPASPVVSPETVFSFYRKFTRMEGPPIDIPERLAILCASGITSPAQAAQDQRKNGPHYQTTVSLLVNDAARRALPHRLATFPVGSVVVKEKLGAKAQVTGVGGMIKRAAGYNPKNGDWEYFYADHGGAFATGHLANCVDCHANARHQDYVFKLRGVAFPGTEAAAPKPR